MLNVVKVVLLACLLSVGAVQAEQPVVKLLANISPPYSDPQLPEQGLAMEAVKHIYARAGYQADIDFDSWTRAMEGVSIGLYDALAAAWYTDARSEEYIYSDPYISSQLIVVKLRSDNADYFEPAHMTGKRLGVRVDYGYGVDFTAIPGLTLVPENHVIQNLLKLLNGKIDLVIGDQRTLALQMQEYLPKEIHKFQVTPMTLPVRNRHVAATRAKVGEAKMIEDFNKALAAVREDGSLAAIIAKWDARYSIPMD